MERSAHTQPVEPPASTPRQQFRLRSFYIRDLPKSTDECPAYPAHLHVILLCATRIQALFPRKTYTPLNASNILKFRVFYSINHKDYKIDTIVR